jgi:hypothetical protein
MVPAYCHYILHQEKERVNMSSKKRCPVSNPQTCCQVAVEFNTQLVPPALASEGVTTEVYFTQPPVIEDVCPEKVIVCGALTKKIIYTAVDEQGNLCEKVICDERPFQCIIDRDDANAGERKKFKVCGYAILCEGIPQLKNRGTRPGSAQETDAVEVWWRLTEKDIVKVCIRKDSCHTCIPLSPCEEALNDGNKPN